MTRIRLKFVQAWVDREGRVHRYFRRPGYPRIRLPGLPGSAEFMAAYQEAYILAFDVATWSRWGRSTCALAVFTVRQSKTGSTIRIPAHTDLLGIIDATPSGNMAFLVTAFGQPFTAAGFGAWFRKRCNEAGLSKDCSFHGLRKAACRRLAEAGCSANEIAAISGHASLREVERYTKAADQERMARNAMARTKGEVRTVKLREV